MGIEFAQSHRSRLGIEWELACVDRANGELAPAAPELLGMLGDFDGFPLVTRELLTNTVELVSAPRTFVRDAVGDLVALLDRVRPVADRLGVDLLCSGTHPFSRALDQRVTPDNPRYDTLLDRTQWWGQQMLIWGVHVHIAVEDRRKVMAIVDGLLTYLPHLLVLSASSPFWMGEQTGYASNRSMLFQQLPTAGLPPQFATWQEYEAMVGDLLHVGVIDDYSELRWDIRPSPRWGTIEVRAFDGIPTVRELAAVAALTQCLVEHLSRELDAGRGVPHMQPWFVRENKWRAARYGMEAIIIQNAAGDERLVTEDLDALVDRLAPVAVDLGCSAELDAVRAIPATGASYQRQLAVAERTGSLRAVVAALVADLHEAAPLPPR